MGTNAFDGIVEPLRRAAKTSLPDRELVAALANRRDESAFEALLRRHGPMVLAVCRRVLGNPHDAEDAFQATFLVLLRKVATIRKREAIGSWLYGVAYHTARRARLMAARRHAKEIQAAPRGQREQADRAVDLDDALNALPEMYRVPVVLCELEGKSRKEVAQQLNIPEGTLSSRLAAARKMLARRLRTCNGTFPGVAPIAVSSPALSDLIRAAKLMLAGQDVIGVVSTKVITLTLEVMKAMFVNKLRALTVAVLVLGTVGGGAGWITQLAFGGGPAATQERTADASDPVQQAAAELSSAKAFAMHAEAELAEARNRVARKEIAYRDAMQRNAPPGAVVGPDASVKVIAGHFKYRVPVETGLTQTKDGGRLEILAVWGTQPEIKVGGLYIVHGKYTLPSYDHGSLYFYETTKGPSGLTNTMDLQSMTVDKAQGEFTLMHAMREPGYFHLHLVGPRYEDSVANVYFGTGDNVWRGM